MEDLIESNYCVIVGSCFVVVIVFEYIEEIYFYLSIYVLGFYVNM